MEHSAQLNAEDPVQLLNRPVTQRQALSTLAPRLSVRELVGHGKAPNVPPGQYEVVGHGCGSPIAAR